MWRKAFAFVVLCLSLATVSSATAQVVSFEFFQGGYDEGAFVAGSFSGIDSNSDGLLNGFTASEITGFAFSFSGNSQVAAFSLGFVDLMGLVYQLDDGLLGDGTGINAEGIFAIGPAGLYFAGDAIGPSCSLSGTCGDINLGATTTAALVTVTRISVPEPGTAALLALAGGALLWRRRRLRRSHT